MYSVIVVDDEPKSAEMIANYIKQYLGADFFVSGCFSCAADALEFIGLNPVHLVITDIKMPEIDGLEFVRILRERSPLCEIILISAYNNFEYAKSGIKYNVFNYLLKPIDFSELFENMTAIKKRLDQMFADDYENEMTELFFSDLFSGRILTKSDYEKRISSVSLPFDSENYYGIILKLSISTAQAEKKWRYSKETVENLMKNLIALILPETVPYLITKHDLSCCFAVFYPQGQPAPDLALLFKQSIQLLDIHVFGEILTYFRSLSEFIGDKHIMLPFDNEAELDDAQINKALEYINSNYQRDISRDDVSAAVYMSPGYFSHYFHEKTGVTFTSYLTKLRMEKAISLLLSGLPVNEIVRKTGYKNKNSFLLNFKKYTGSTPTEYKKGLIHGGQNDELSR